jgi:hypothetical protein
MLADARPTPNSAAALIRLILCAMIVLLLDIGRGSGRLHAAGPAETKLCYGCARVNDR